MVQTAQKKQKRINRRREARLKAGIDERRAAKVAGVCLSTFQRYESGCRVPYHRALPLSELFNCRIEIFMRYG